MLHAVIPALLLLEQNISVSFGIWILLVFSLVIIAGGIGLFLWAYLTGQFNDINKGAQLPFNEEEPVGQRTDQIFREDTDSLGNMPAEKENSTSRSGSS